MSTKFQKAYFLLSAAEIKQLPPDHGIEVAMVGRSNAGKSSVLNRITRQGQLARVSKTPGRTQLINVFVVDETRRLIDLPGYGFAKVPLAAKLKWEKAIDAYMQERESLKGVVLIMDIRHPLRDMDVSMMDYCKAANLKVHILLNKADKLGRGAGVETLRAVKSALFAEKETVSVQLFSAQTGAGLSELETVLSGWYELK